MSKRKAKITSNAVSPPAASGSQPLEQISEKERAPDPESAKRPSARYVINSIRSFLRQINWSLVATILAIKGLIFVFGVQSYHLLANVRFESWRGVLEIWNYWDSQRHLRLAEFGYTNVGEERFDLVGFPLYPWFVRAFAFIFQDYLLSGFIVAGLASIAAGLLLYRLVLLDHSEAVARNSVWFLFIFPTSYFLHINYSESLFIALTLGTLFAARQKHWALAGILGALTCLTRLNGLIIVPALMIEAITQYRETGKLQRQYLWTFAAPAGFAVYLLLNYRVTGNAFAFIAFGRENFYKSLDTPWNGIKDLYKLAWIDPPAEAMMIGVQELFFVLLGAVCAIACWRFLRPAYTIWIVGNWLLFTSVGFILSVPRYTLTLFPIFILFAVLAQRFFWHSVITIWSLLFLALFIGQFIRGHWAF